MKKFKDDFELILGSIFFSITFILVCINVFTRYFLSFTFNWTEEVAVGCFVWTIFLGFANAYRTDSLIGVEVLMNLVPKNARKYVELFTALVIMILSGAMLYFSYIYVAGSTKITAALEVSYIYIYASIVLAFALITFYAIMKMIISFKRIKEDETPRAVKDKGGIS